jgi:hypothetical protein
VTRLPIVLALSLSAVALAACGSRPGLAECSLDGDCGNGICEGGKCAVQACNAGLTPCGRRCVNLQADSTDCGGCGFTCPTQCIRTVCQPLACFGNLGFPTWPLTAAGTTPAGAVAADLDRNGVEDLVVASAVDPTLWVLRSDGRSLAATSSALSASAVALAAADFNRDLNPDLAVALSGGTIALLTGLGDGTFAAGGTIAGSGGSALAAGDFDGDGRPDLISAAPALGAAHFLRNQPTQTISFAAPVVLVLPASALASSVVAADADGDGLLDAVVGDSNGGVQVFFGDGRGAFTAALPLVSGAISPAIGVAVGDFDGDGKPDVAAINAGLGGVTLHRGLGSRAFASQSLTGCSDPTALAALPLAGKTSLAVACQGFGDSGVVLYSPGAPGTVGPARQAAGGTPVFKLAPGKYQYSGNVDLAAVVFLDTNVFATVLSSDGEKLAGGDYRAGPTNRAVTTADLDGDRRPDVVVADGFGNSTIGVFLNSAQGLGARTTYPVGNNPYWVAIGDLNGDHIPDLAVADFGSNGVGVLLGLGGGRFGPHALFGVGSSPRAVAIADLNGDGKPDLVSVNNGSNDASVLLGNGNGTFRAPVTYPVGPDPYFMTTADVDGDGKLDVISVNTGIAPAADANTVGVLRGRGDGTLEAMVTYPVGPNPHHVVAVDLNGDGRLDLVVSSNNSSPGTGDTVSVLLALPGGGFAPQVKYEAGGNAYGLAVADLDGDGKLDIVVARDRDDGIVAVLLGGGNGAFAAARYYAFFGGEYVAVADVNGDMAPDLLSSGVENMTVGLATCR